MPVCHYNREAIADHISLGAVRSGQRPLRRLLSAADNEPGKVNTIVVEREPYPATDGRPERLG